METKSGLLVWILSKVYRVDLPWEYTRKPTVSTQLFSFISFGQTPNNKLISLKQVIDINLWVNYSLMINVNLYRTNVLCEVISSVFPQRSISGQCMKLPPTK